jgi:hypothetical protein
VDASARALCRLPQHARQLAGMAAAQLGPALRRLADLAACGPLGLGRQAEGPALTGALLALEQALVLGSQRLGAPSAAVLAADEPGTSGGAAALVPAPPARAQHSPGAGRQEALLLSSSSSGSGASSEEGEEEGGDADYWPGRGDSSGEGGGASSRKRKRGTGWRGSGAWQPSQWAGEGQQGGPSTQQQQQQQQHGIVRMQLTGRADRHHAYLTSEAARAIAPSLQRSQPVTVEVYVDGVLVAGTEAEQGHEQEEEEKGRFSTEVRVFKCEARGHICNVQLLRVMEVAPAGAVPKMLVVQHSPGKLPHLHLHMTLGAGGGAGVSAGAWGTQGAGAAAEASAAAGAAAVRVKDEQQASPSGRAVPRLSPWPRVKPEPAQEQATGPLEEQEQEEEDEQEEQEEEDLGIAAEPGHAAAAAAAAPAAAAAEPAGRPSLRDAPARLSAKANFLRQLRILRSLANKAGEPAFTQEVRLSAGRAPPWLLCCLAAALRCGLADGSSSPPHGRSAPQLLIHC